MDGSGFVTKEEFWRLQVTVDGLSAAQAQQAERIMRIEKKSDDGTRSKPLWGPASPFSAGLNSSHSESTLNPAAEAFRNFDSDPPVNMISSLTLDSNDEARRAASRAASVRFDESANHYAPSRQSIDLPTRTGSGLGSHPLSERSLSHRSEGRNSVAGFSRANSFGLEHSRLLGSIHNSPRVSGHPPPGLFALSPCPAIVRCWLTETFTNDTLMYAAVCTGAASSSIGLQLLQSLGLDAEIFEENGLKKIRLMIYLTEAKVQLSSSRSSSPSPQVPTVTAKFLVDEHTAHDKSIQIVIGSDTLRLQCADLLLSQDKLVIYDDTRNQLSVPLVRPEDDNIYRYLMTKARTRSGSMASETLPSDLASEVSAPGIIGRPSRLNSMQGPNSPITDLIPSSGKQSSEASDLQRPDAPRQILMRPTNETSALPQENSRSSLDADGSITSPSAKASSSGAWASSWRSAAAGASSTSKPSDLSNVANGRVGPRPMKVLRAGKSMASSTRAASNPPTPTTITASSNGQAQPESRESPATPGQPPATKSNPVGSGSAFGWLNSRRTTTSGGP